MRRFVVRFLKVTLIGAAIVGVAVGACVYLTDPKPATLPTRAQHWIAQQFERPPEAPRRVEPPQQKVPPFSDVLFDDSGYAFACAFTGETSATASLEEYKKSVVGRNRRGIAVLEKKLAALPPGAPSTPHDTEQLHLMIGFLLMYEGKWREANEHFVKAQDADPDGAPLYRANLDALRGVASLRRGEIENCVSCCNEASCIFPLAAAAVHQRPAGSREAIGHFTRYLRKRPEDMGVQWLLNIAYMTLGEYPQGVPTEFLLPLGRFASTSGPTKRMTNVASRVGLNTRGESMAGTCIVDDFDGDGLLDVFMPTTDAERGASLWHNLGDGNFEDRSDTAGLADQVLSLNSCHTDYDNDGRPDILMMRGAWESARRLSLLHNRGDGTFEDVTVAAGLDVPISSPSAAWADYDNDGFVDLYVAGEYDAREPDGRDRGRLYRNRGDGTFEERGEAAGVLNERFGKGVTWGDYDNDGRPDLYVSNLGQPNRLYHNNGDGTFTDLAESLGVAEPLSSFACWFWDYDNDGRLDLWVNPNDATLSQVVLDHLGRTTGGERPRLYRNVGGDRPFRDVTTEVGLDRVVLPMGSSFGDVDNDGFLDIYLGTGRPSYSYLMPNLMFRNVGGLRFDDVTASTGTGHLQKGHGIAFADWDRDGDMDLFVQSGGAAPGDGAHNVLFQNPGNGNHWLTIKLVGTRTNRAAFGARIRVDLPGSSLHRAVGSVPSFGGNPLSCTVGLGRSDTIRLLEVSWPTSGTRQAFHDVPIDRSIEITEGQDGFRVLDAKPIPLP